MIKALFAARGDPLLRVHPVEAQPPADAPSTGEGLAPGSMLFRLTWGSPGR
jgi:hypothetical protein